jgi:hypothetical protein
VGLIGILLASPLLVSYKVFKYLKKKEEKKSAFRRRCREIDKRREFENFKQLYYVKTNKKDIFHRRLASQLF